MKILIWLWNPWDKYKNTRHNIWFMFLDFFAEKNDFSDFSYESKFKADISNWKYKWEKVILLKPQTFMNLSWESVRKICDYYKVGSEDFIVIYDDISLEFGKVRFREKWSAWWHNWVKDIIKYFKDKFPRIKIWVWLDEKYEVSDWVLSKFTEEELIDLENEVFKNVENYTEENI